MKTKKISQLGFRPIQASFIIQVKSVYLPQCCSVKDGAVLNISFQRGLNESSTGNFIYHKSNRTNENVILLKDKLELVVVLYKAVNSTLYQKKSANLILRELIKQSTGKYIYQNNGVCCINLEQVLNKLDFELNITKNGFVVFNNLDGAMLKFSLTATLQKIENTARYLRQDDNQFIGSDLSDSDSTVIKNTIISYSEAVFLSDAEEDDLSKYPDSSSEEPEHAPGWSVYEERDKSANSSNTNSSSEPESGVAHRMHPWPDPSSAHTNTIMYIDAASRLTSPVPLTPAPHEHNTAPIGMRLRTLSSTSTVESTKEIHDLYRCELHRQAQLIENLEQRIHTQSIQIAEQQSMGRMELEQMKSALQEEYMHRNDSKVNNNKFNTEYQQWSKEYNSIHTEIVTLIPFHTETAIQRCTIQDELTSLREKISELSERLSSESTLIYQAATIAAQATIQRDEVEEQSRFLLTALIEVKMNTASVAEELMKARRGRAVLQRWEAQLDYRLAGLEEQQRAKEGPLG